MGSQSPRRSKVGSIIPDAGDIFHGDRARGSSEPICRVRTGGSLEQLRSKKRVEGSIECGRGLAGGAHKLSMRRSCPRRPASEIDEDASDAQVSEVTRHDRGLCTLRAGAARPCCPSRNIFYVSE